MGLKALRGALDSTTKRGLYNRDRYIDHQCFGPFRFSFVLAHFKAKRIEIPTPPTIKSNATRRVTKKSMSV